MLHESRQKLIRLSKKRIVPNNSRVCLHLYECWCTGFVSLLFGWYVPAPFFVFEMGRQLLSCLLTCHVYLLFWVLFTYLCRWKKMRQDWATTRWGPVLSYWTTTAGCITWLVPWTKAKNKMILAWQYIRLDQDQVKIPEHAHWWKSGIKISIKLRENTCGSYFGSVFTLMVAHNLALFMTVLLIRTKRFMDFAAPTHSFAPLPYKA